MSVVPDIDHTVGYFNLVFLFIGTLLLALAVNMPLRFLRQGRRTHGLY